MSLEVRKFVAPEIVFGAGVRRLLPRYIDFFGARRPLVVTDPGVRAAGWTDEIVADLAAAGFEARVFDAVSPNPRDHEVAAGVARFEAEGCDLLVAVGGGSPIDCAKGIGIATSNGVPVHVMEGVDRVEMPGPPLVCIPTTAGSAADVSQFAIITRPDERRKLAVISKALVPDLALIDPETTVTMDPYLTACTGVDALVHALEALVSTGASSLTRVHALSAIETLGRALPAVVESPEDVPLRAQVLDACTQAGLAFSNASLGAVHALAHALGGRLDLPHGECNALLLEHVVRFNYSEAQGAYREASRALGLPPGATATVAGKDLLTRLSELVEALGIAPGLNRRGVERSALSDLARNAAIDPCLVTNPRRASSAELESIYAEAL